MKIDKDHFDQWTGDLMSLLIMVGVVTFMQSDLTNLLFLLVVQLLFRQGRLMVNLKRVETQIKGKL